MTETSPTYKFSERTFSVSEMNPNGHDILNPQYDYHFTVTEFLKNPVTVIAPLDIPYECSRCGKYNSWVLVDDVPTIMSPCTFVVPSQIMSRLTVTSGAIIVSNSLMDGFETLPWSQEESLNHAAGREKFYSHYENRGLLYALAMSDVTVFRDTDTLVWYFVASNSLYDEADELVPVPETWEQVYYVTTALWAYNLADAGQYWGNRAALQPTPRPEWQSYKEVEVPNGVYELVRNTRYDDPDQDAPDEGIRILGYLSPLSE